MQTYPAKFPAVLAAGLKPFYLIFGEEPQQKIQAIEAVRATAKENGFDERQSFSADASFNWNLLLEACQSLSLFSSKTYIELELLSGKPGAEGAKVLASISAQDNQDILIVLHGPKIGKDVQNAKWFKSLDKQGVYVPCYMLEGNQLFQWVNQYAKQVQVSIDMDAVKLISDFCEGNLLAAKQEIDKLSLLYLNRNVQLAEVEKAVVDQSRFNVFQLIDVMLSGDAQKTIKMLYRLEVEGVEPTIIVWALAREWQVLSNLKFAQKSAQTINWNQYRIWKNRQNLYIGAMNRLSDAQLDAAQRKLAIIDQKIKGSVITRPYIEIAHLCLLFIPTDLNALPLAH